MLMKGFAKTLGDVLSTIDGIVWGPIMLCLLVGTGVILTIRTRGLSFNQGKDGG